MQMNPTIKKLFRIIYFFITGLIVMYLTLPFAAGLREDPSNGYPYPQFFIIMAIWALGWLLHFKYFWIGVIISLIPIVFFYPIFKIIMATL